MADQVEIADIIKSIQADVTTIVKGEIELAKAELMPQAKAAGIGAGLFGAAGYFGLTAALLLFLSLSFAVSLAFSAWVKLDFLGSLAAGFAVTALLLLVVTAVLALLGKRQLVFTGAESTVAQAEASVAAVKGAVERGKADVDSLSLTGAPREIA